MKGSVLTLVLAGVLGVGSTALVVGPADADSTAGNPDAERLLNAAQRAPLEVDFTGTVLVGWNDSGDWTTEEVPVRSTDGVLAVGDEAMAQGDHRYVRRDGDWQELSAPEAAAETAPGWVSDVTGLDEVAGRPCTEVEVGHDGALVERVCIDQNTMLALRRELYDAAGERARSVEFAQITLQPLTTPPTLPNDSRTTTEPAAVQVSAPLRAPEEINGYVLRGVYADAGNSVRLVYSNGIAAASVLEQRGRVDWNSTPAGTAVTVAGHDGRLISGPNGQAVVVEGDEYVVTVVADAPIDSAAIAEAFVSESSPSVVDRVVNVALAPFRWL